MTYQDIVNWCERNVPMGQAENFIEWLSMCESEFLNSGHFLPEQVEGMLESRWYKFHPSTESGQQEEIASRLDRFEQQRDKEGITVSQQLERRISKFPQDLTFTPKQIAQFSGLNRNTVRRELQEMEHEGTIERISKGRYRLIP